MIVNMMTIWPAHTQNKNLIVDLPTVKIQNRLEDSNIRNSRESQHLIFKRENIFQCSFKTAFVLVFLSRSFY